MNAPLSLFAPGKLIWMGEYAVLDGAPSIVQAVDRGLHLDYAPSDASLTVSSDLWAGNLLLTEATADRAETALLAAVVATLTEACAALAPLTGTLKLASPDLIDATTGLKFGFGSSAAAAAALTVALGRLAGLPDDRLAALAHAAHRRFQKGAGSGVDVETSLFGGLAAMQRGPSGLSVTPLQLPPGLRIAVLHAGEAANTRTMLATLAAARAAALPGVEAALASMAEAAEASVAAIVAGDVSDFLTRVARFADAERALSPAASLPHHERLGRALHRGRRPRRLGRQAIRSRRRRHCGRLCSRPRTHRGPRRICRECTHPAAPAPSRSCRRVGHSPCLTFRAIRLPWLAPLASPASIASPVTSGWPALRPPAL